MPAPEYKVEAFILYATIKNGRTVKRENPIPHQIPHDSVIQKVLAYGHPTEDTLSRLRDADVTVFRTDMQGDIYCTSDGQTVIFSVQKNANVDTLAPMIQETQAPATAAPTDQAEEPVGTDYILNANTRKFHYPSCRSVKQMKESNKVYFTGTRDEVIAKGYKPCGNCHP